MLPNTPQQLFVLFKPKTGKYYTHTRLGRSRIVYYGCHNHKSDHMLLYVFLQFHQCCNYDMCCYLIARSRYFSMSSCVLGRLMVSLYVVSSLYLVMATIALIVASEWVTTHIDWTTHRQLIGHYTHTIQSFLDVGAPNIRTILMQGNENGHQPLHFECNGPSE